MDDVKSSRRWWLRSAGRRPQPRGAAAAPRSKGLRQTVLFALAVGVALWAAGLPRGLRGLGERLGVALLRADSVIDGEEFDYIVVGAGAAGSAVAARLALSGARVLLLEAGGQPGLASEMPGAAMSLSASSIAWHYDTLSNNKSCLGSVGAACRFTRGRCVGGSTGLNYMMYTRGNRRDYDYGLPGWSWERLEPYFLRYEGLYDARRLPAASARHHNTSGVVPVGFFGDSANPWHERVVEGLEALGVPYNPDVNAASQIGVSQVLGYTAGGARVNVARAYLGLPGVRRALRLVTHARCTGVIIDEHNVARGVTVAGGAHGSLRLYARREVVLSAGAVATPQLLMLSGVGPREHLRRLGIAVRADLPVGEGMADHAVSPVYVRVDDERGAASPLAALGAKGLQAAQWLAARRGPLASIGLTDVTAFVNTACYDFARRRLLRDRPECELPSVQLIHAYAERGFGRLARAAVRDMMAQRDDVFEDVFSANDESSFVVVSPVLLQPRSRGRVRLASADPAAPPAIEPNYLADERDVAELVRALRLVEQLVRAPAYARHNASVLRVPVGACAGEYWACYARHMTQSVQHAVGTAALGRVLDARLRVRGVRRLRVADAAALPRLPRGNTAAAVLALGERAADLLLEDRWRLK
ncbi:glucose dehydrogenase [FAD, quinone]-like isoform X2 [Bicyclus anynana]|uniref:Glucose dehydrogenase [FAD, quinone]-like isoform X2 n=1 Tax=Bicyclus anynana TaxID=110368 RepID=A0ABM3LQR4_BICAN|nr:glucose dehydrogenase [FAD, quinone]-like isoform X2 [Bicyclus anynana]